MAAEEEQDPNAMVLEFWNTKIEEVENMNPHTGFKNLELPLARIKKIMKLDEDVKMISAEAPILFSKACEHFINELTLRAWCFTEENKRRTLQKSDIALAISKNDQFDFLIDIVPRDEQKPATATRKAEENKPANTSVNQVQYYLQLAQQHQSNLQQQQQLQHRQQQQQQHFITQTVGDAAAAAGGAQQIIQIQAPTSAIQTQNGGQTMIQLTAQQLEQIKQQLNMTNQPIVIQTSAAAAATGTSAVAATAASGGDATPAANTEATAAANTPTNL